MNKRATKTDLRLKRLYDAMESGVADLDDPALKERIAGLKAIRDQAQADASSRWITVSFELRSLPRKTTIRRGTNHWSAGLLLRHRASQQLASSAVVRRALGLRPYSLMFQPCVMWSMQSI